MDRATVNLLLRVALLLPVLAASPVARAAGPVTPGPGQGADWPMVRRDPAGSAATRLRTTDGRRPEAWQFQAGSHVWGYQPGMSVWSSPAVGLVKGRAVVLAGSYDNNLYCLDAASGRKLWRFTTGGGIYAAPALWNAPDGSAWAFVASSDRMLYALDADLGRRRWIHAVQTWRPTIGGARLSSPAVGHARGRAAVFFGHWVWDKSMAGHMQVGGLSALDALTGKRLWTTRLGDNQVSSPIYVEPGGAARVPASAPSSRPATSPRAGRIFVAAENGNLYAINADDGQVLWTHTDHNAIKASPAYFDSPLGGRVVIGSKYGAVRCLDARTGVAVWSYKTSHWVDGSAAVARIGGRLTVLAGSYDTNLHALDAHSGQPLWSYRTAGGVYSSPAIVPLPATRRDGAPQVLIASWDHHLHCVDSHDGSLVWSAFLGRPLWDSVTLGDSTWSSPVVAEINGRVVAYVGSYSGPLYAIPLDEAADKALARPSSNLRFWVTLPLVVLAVIIVTLLITRRHRRRIRDHKQRRRS